MKTIQLNTPDTVDLDEREAKMHLASRLYEKGKVTLGQAADLVGLSKRAFMELLGDYDVAIVNYPASELDGDIINAYKITTNHANQQLFTQVLSN